MLVVAAVVAVLALPDQNRQTATASLLALALPALVAAAIAVLWLRALDLVAGLWSGGRAGAPLAGGSAVRSGWPAGGLALLGPTVLDPTPRLPPLVRAAPAWSDLVALGVVTIVLVLVATAVARRRIRSLTTAEVLRGEE